MAKRFIDSDLFKKRFIRNLKGAYKLLWVYLFCECDNAGIWEVDIEAAEFFCGEKYSLVDLKKDFTGKIYFFSNGRKAFIPDFIEFQYGEELNEKNPAHRSVIFKLNKYQLLDFLNKRDKEEGANEGLQNPLDAPMDKDKDKNKEIGSKKPLVVRTKTFFKPTIEEVIAYCSERGNIVDAQAWIDYYTSNGWKVGKNPMRDWKAAVRTWERNGRTNNDNNNGRHGQKDGDSSKSGFTKVPGNTTKKKYTGTL